MTDRTRVSLDHKAPMKLGCLPLLGVLSSFLYPSNYSPADIRLPSLSRVHPDNNAYFAALIVRFNQTLPPSASPTQFPPERTIPFDPLLLIIALLHYSDDYESHTTERV